MTDWSLGVMPNIGQNALTAFQQGREMRRQEDTRNALATYAANPSEQSLNALAPYAPEVVIQQRQQMARTQQQQQELAAKKHQEQVGIIGRLLSGVRDEGTYQQALAAARQGGIDLTEVPQTYDPNWVNQTKLLVSAYQQDGGQALSNYGKIAMDAGLQPGTPEFTAFVTKAWEADQVKTIATQPGGGVAQFNPVTNRTEMVIAPNTGGYAAGTPVQGGAQAGPAPGATVNGFRFKGGNPNDRNSWEPVGGSGGNVGGGFRP